MSGSIKKVSRAGGDVFQVYGRRAGGKKYLGTVSTEGEAKELLEDDRVTQRQIDRGELPPELDRKRTLDESLTTWLRAYRKRSKATYENRVDLYIRPYFKQTPLTRVTPAMVEEFQTWLVDVKKLKQSTVNGVVATLSGAFTYFVKVKKWVAENPVGSVQALEETKRKYNWLRSRDEQEKLLAACNEPLRTMAAVLLMSGMRLSEMTHLHWTDVALDLRLITIQRGKHGTTKSGEERTVPINDALLPVLKAWKLQAGASALVFPGRGGKVRHPSSVREPFKAALVKAGLDPSLRVHDCRHTYASHYLREGGNIFRLSKYLGHSSVTITEHVYGHMAPEDFEKDWGRNCLRMPTAPAKVIRLAGDIRETAETAAFKNSASS